MILQSLPNNDLLTYLDSVGVAGHFARYVARQAAGIRSPAVLEDGEIVGVALSGLPAGIYEAASCWIFAATSQGFSLLLEEVLRTDFFSLNFPLHYTNIVEARNSDLLLSVDRLYTLHPAEFRPVPDRYQVVQLTSRLLNGIEVAHEMMERIGDITTLPEGFPLYGIIVEGRLSAIAEAAVRDESVASIQQVYTLTSERGKGLGKSVVSAIGQELLNEGFLPAYFVSETNHSSIALAESLGFRLESRWGCAEEKM